MLYSVTHPYHVFLSVNGDDQHHMTPALVSFSHSHTSTPKTTTSQKKKKKNNIQLLIRPIVIPHRHLVTHSASRGVDLQPQRLQHAVEQIRRLHAVPIATADHQLVEDRLGMHRNAAMLRVVQR